MFPMIGKHNMETYLKAEYMPTILQMMDYKESPMPSIEYITTCQEPSTSRKQLRKGVNNLTGGIT